MYARLTQHRRGDEGFTLIELAVVLAILGLLIAVSLQGYHQARRAAARDEARSIGREWLDLEWACILAQGPPTHTGNGTCDTDRAIGFGQPVVTNWDFSGTTTANSGGAASYVVAQTDDDVSVVRCAQSRAGSHAYPLQYEIRLVVSSTVNAVSASASSDTFAATCPEIPASAAPR